MSITNDGSYYEDFTVGDTLIHQRGRTITQMDNHMFTSLVMNTAVLPPLNAFRSVGSEPVIM